MSVDAGTGSARRYRTDKVDTGARQGPCRNHRRGTEHADQRTGQSGGPSLYRDEECQHRDAEHHRRPVERRCVIPQGAQLIDDRVRGTGDAGHPAELTDDHDDGDSGQITHQHRLRQQARHEAQPQQPRDDTDDPDQKGKRRRITRVSIGIRVQHEGRQHDSGHHRRGRLGPYGQLPRSPEECIDQQGRQCGPQPDYGIQPGQRRIGESLRHQVRRDTDAGQPVTAEP